MRNFSSIALQRTQQNMLFVTGRRCAFLRPTRRNPQLHRFSCSALCLCKRWHTTAAGPTARDDILPAQSSNKKEEGANMETGNAHKESAMEVSTHITAHEATQVVPAGDHVIKDSDCIESSTAAATTADALPPTQSKLPQEPEVSSKAPLSAAASASTKLASGEDSVSHAFTPEADDAASAETTEPKKDPLDEAERGTEIDDSEDELLTYGRKAHTDAQRKMEQAKRLREAEAHLAFAELMAPETINKYVDMTEVSTVSGIRWLDICAKSSFRNSKLLSKQGEGSFAASVLHALHGSSVPADLYVSISNGSPLPTVHIEENWVCMVLRVSREATRGYVEHNQTIGTASRSRGQQQKEYAARYAEALYSSSSSERHAQDMSTRRRRYKMWARRNMTGSDADGTGLCGLGETGNLGETFISSPPAGDSFIAGSTDPSERFRYDESTNQYLQVKKSRWERFLEERGNKEKLHRKLREHDKKASKRRIRATKGVGAALQRELGAPTLTDLTDRLSVFIYKELHPIEEEGVELPMKEADVQDVTKLVLMEMDEHGNVISHYVEHSTSEEKAALRKSGSSKGGGKGQVKSGTADTKLETVTNASSASEGEEEGGDVKTQAKRYHTRWRIITVHRVPVPFIEDAMRRWPDLIMSRRPTADVGGVQHLHHPAISGWEDIARLIFNGTAGGLQESTYRNTRLLEQLEMEIFSPGDSTGDQLKHMTTMMAQLHTLNRRATIYSSNLREMKVTFTKLKTTLNSPLTAADKKALTYLQGSLSLAAHLEEHTKSLLFLQFSVAMSRMEDHLRTLTLFSTLFIPLDFIASFFGMNFHHMDSYRNSSAAAYSVLALIGVTALAVGRWIRKNLRR